MAFFITTCFADWQADTFQRGVMAFRNGQKVDDQIRRALRPDEREEVHWWRKLDPDFDQMTYSRCHRQLRHTLRTGDTLFFRTLWRGKPYLIGYFTVVGIEHRKDDRIILATRDTSRLIHYRLPVTAGLVRFLNPRATARRSCDFNHWVNARLGRSYLRLGNPAGAYLRALIDEIAASV